MILYCKSVFLAVNASLRWLNKVSCLCIVHVSLLLIVQRGFRRFLQVLALASLLAGGLCKFYANSGGKRLIHRQAL